MVHFDKLNLFNKDIFSQKDHLQDVNTVFNEVKNTISDQHDFENKVKWNNLPGSYGAYSGNIEELSKQYITQKWLVVNLGLDTQKISTHSFDSLKISDDILKGCLQNNKQYTIYSNDGVPEIIQLYDISTGTYIDKSVKGILYTIETLKMGIPVVFGVNSLPYEIADSSDVSTSHFIVILGMGNDGRNYFYGWDTGCLLLNGERNKGDDENLGLSQSNKLYLDTEWPGLIRADETWPNYYSKARQPYKVTQIFRTFNV